MISRLIIPPDIKGCVERALEEDIGTGDLTAMLIPENKIATAEVVCRENAVICGIPWFEEVYRQLDPSIKIIWKVADGDLLQTNTSICTLQGSARVILTGERTALNFIQMLSATSTETYQYVQLIKDSNTTLLDTRKTIPGLRTAQKYAVVCGGGKNHRIGLYDAILIKENHIHSAGNIATAHNNARKIHRNIEIEVETLDELQQALDAGATQILLDNFTLEMMNEAVMLNAGRATLEVSGGVNKDSVQSIAATGVDYVSVGALTKNLRAIDFSMRVISE
ncbi:MAG: nicotinate-nucleotide pyrophosphorylase (carboxylating) [Gammaproteobacteria bacterium]|jgi:nicotinate-nucleotide pyrophosphorylase (carboxylating)